MRVRSVQRRRGGTEGAGRIGRGGRTGGGVAGGIAGVAGGIVGTTGCRSGSVRGSTWFNDSVSLLLR